MNVPVAASHNVAPEPPVDSSNINTWPVRCSSKCTGGIGNENGPSHWPTAEGSTDPFTTVTLAGVDVVWLPAMSRAGLLMVWAPAIHVQTSPRKRLTTRMRKRARSDVIAGPPIGEDIGAFGAGVQQL